MLTQEKKRNEDYGTHKNLPNQVIFFLPKQFLHFASLRLYSIKFSTHAVYESSLPKSHKQPVFAEWQNQSIPDLTRDWKASNSEWSDIWGYVSQQQLEWQIQTYYSKQWYSHNNQIPTFQLAFFKLNLRWRKEVGVEEVYYLRIAELGNDHYHG